VEKRFGTDETFGQNRTSSRQLTMTMEELIEEFSKPAGDLLYLSTQETEDDDAFQMPPCKQLLEAGYLDPTLDLAGHLVLHSCNLWMGKSRSGSSSGLHHDYHDNFYLLLRGRKRFRLYSPDCAMNMYTYGKIDVIHRNGFISYVGSETRADGVPLGDDDYVNSNVEDTDDEEDEEEVVLGKGYDYKSDDDEGGGSDVFSGEDGVDDFDEIMGVGDDDEPITDVRVPESGNGSRRPNSFSGIDLAKEDLADYPLFSSCKECIVELKAGQTLYLPAGWFHEVTSFGDEDVSASPREQLRLVDCNELHMAVNYWFHPPDALTNFEEPYEHSSYWRESKRKAS
jgi:hypothetical protein